MARRGCVRVDSLSLQILLNDNPSWAGTPVAVTREEKPQSPILALNREARDRGLSRGMRYSSALALVPTLRARRVPPGRIQEARALIVRTVFSFTPDIEPCPFDPDAIWVSLEGLRSLFDTERRWIGMVQQALASRGFSSIVVTGYTRFGTWIVSRSRDASLVLSSPREERAVVARSSVDILPLSPRARSTLRRLGMHTVRQFVSLPSGETARRLGRDARWLQQSILSDDPLPIRAADVEETVTLARRLEAPVKDLDLLLPHVRELIQMEVEHAEKGRSVIEGIVLRLRTEEGQWTTEVVRPATPTLRVTVLMRLLTLRLCGRQFASAIEEMQLGSVRTAPSGEQGELFACRTRDLPAGARAFAAIRARCGNESVMRFQVSDAHLPDRSFRLVPMDQPALPAAPTLPDGEEGAPGPPVAVRRILYSPSAEGEGRLPEDERTALLASGSWWGTGEADAPYRRSYWYHHSPRGTLWRYEDQLTGTCWLQGWVD